MGHLLSTQHRRVLLRLWISHCGLTDRTRVTPAHEGMLDPLDIMPTSTKYKAKIEWESKWCVIQKRTEHFGRHHYGTEKKWSKFFEKKKKERILIKSFLRRGLIWVRDVVASLLWCSSFNRDLLKPFWPGSSNTVGTFYARLKRKTTS